MMATLLRPIALFTEAAVFTLFTVAIGYGDFDQGPLFFFALFCPIAIGAVALAVWLPEQATGRVITHGALLTGCFIFAFPFLWLVSTSFKYNEEIFVYPPRWIPAIPSSVERSPFVTDEPLAEMPLEESNWSDSDWNAAWPEMASALWQHHGQQIRKLPGAERVPEDELREAVLRGIVNYGARSLPAATWADGPEAVTAHLNERIDKDLLGTVWEAVYRAVSIREPTIQSVHRDFLSLPAGNRLHVESWQVLAGPAMLDPVQEGPTRLLRYDFANDQHVPVVLQGSFPLPIPQSEFLGMTLPLRQDRSWHAVHVELELGGQRYHSVDDLYLDTYKWQEIGFKLAHLDDHDDRELGIWTLELADEQSGVFDGADQFRVTVEIEHSSSATATWRKYTNHYRKARLAAKHWWSYVVNSVYLVVMTMVGQVFSCSIVAYAFSRLNWPGREVLFAVLLATMMLPAQVTMIPVFMIFEKLGWYNTLRALWAPSFLGSAFYIFLLRQFMKSIPDELEDAAKIDGCSYFGIYWRIILPLVKPALAAVCIFTFMGTWNDFMGPLIYINDQRLYPLALGLFDFRALHATDFGMLMAASTLMTLPVIALFFVAQRYFIQGVTLTGIKG